MNLISYFNKYFRPDSEIPLLATMPFSFFATRVLDLEGRRVFLKNITYRTEFEPI